MIRPTQIPAVIFIVAFVFGCGEDPVARDAALDGLMILDVNPGAVVPGSRVVVEGRSFVEEPWGESFLKFAGSFGGGGAEEWLVPATFVDFDHLQVSGADGLYEVFGSREGTFSGEISVAVISGVDGETYESPPIAKDLELRSELVPSLMSVHDEGFIFVNELLTVAGQGLLLGGDEGTSFAVVEGCFTSDGGGVCEDVGIARVPVVPTSEFDRTTGEFMFEPSIVGIRGGQFTGTVFIENDHRGGALTESDTASVDYTLIEATVIGLSPSEASLGQYVDIEGGGFIGEGATSGTLIALSGEFSQDGGETRPVDLLLVPEFVNGTLVRYVMSESDSLGQAVDLRNDTGTFTGFARPIVRFDGDEVTGASNNVTFRIGPVKQIVYLKYTTGFVESLRHFGLRAMEQRIRERVEAVMVRDYRTINLEVRSSRPIDFAIYSTVEIGGEDPNGIGLLGYDNTPGKDVGNQRLGDQIGGVNAQTLEDGFPGYGGVFVESMFSFSKHPGKFASSSSAGDEVFDQIFDAFRPDRDGQQVLAADIGAGIETLTDGSSCPASDRPTRIACAVWTMGNLIGTTLSHEVGHSLGLANPFGQAFHNPFNEQNRLMDSGGARPFTERAQLFGDGPATFCDDAYDYLRNILNTGEPGDTTPRPSCL